MSEPVRPYFVKCLLRRWPALDLGVDLSTPAGEFLANVMASAAQWERRIIGGANAR